MKESLELSLDDWKQIIDGAISEGMMFASLSGGECLTSPYFDEIYQYLHSKGILITVLTNGLLLNQKLALFKKFPPAYIQISIYGKDEEQYENVTGMRCYSLVKENINKAIDSGLPVGIAVTVSKYLKSIIEILQDYSQKNIPITVNQWLIPPYSSTGRMIEDVNLSLEEQVKISLELLTVSNMAVPEPLKDVLPMEAQNIVDSSKKGITCAAGRSDFSISWFGAMSMCVALNTPTGFPLEEGFHTAWIKTNLAATNFQMPIECEECVYKKICQHCPAQHLVFAESGHCSKKVCEETKLMVKMGLLKLDV